MTNPTPVASETTIYCPDTLRKTLWPSPLADQWHEQYSGLFDKDDLRLASSQPANHFYEWFVSVFLFQRDGACSMMEKYVYPSHRLKFARYTSVLTEDQRSELDSIRKTIGIQLPDLLVLAHDEATFSFAEVKGDRDRLSDKQMESHEVIRRLGVSVEVVKVKLARF